MSRVTADARRDGAQSEQARKAQALRRAVSAAPAGPPARLAQSPSTRAPLALAGALLATLACALLLALAQSAHAAITHPFLGALPEPPGAENLLEPTAVAIDHKSGQIFVGDEDNGVIDIYSSAGAFQQSFGEELEPAAIAIDEASGDIYVAEPSADALIAFRPQGSSYQLLSEWSGANSPEGAFGEVSAVAFDNAKEGGSDPAAGDLYVLISESPQSGFGAVELYKPKPNPTGSEENEGQEGAYESSIEEGPKLEEPNAIAIDSSTGRVLVADTEGGYIASYSDKGAFEEKLTGKGQPFGSFKGKEEEEENILGLTIEESTGDIYVAEAEHHAISQYDAGGNWLGASTTAAEAKPLEEPRGIAVSSAGELYGADSLAGLTEHFAGGVVVPDVITGKASKATRTSAILQGSINGDGKSGAKYAFQWGATEALGTSTTPQSAGPGEEKVQATLQGLKAGTSYFFRIIGENENGRSYGLIHELQTPPAVEGLSTGAITELKATSATLTGSLTPGGIETHYFFQWGPSTSYGNQTPLTDAGEGQSAIEAKAALGSLTPNSTYHYRLVGENEFGQTLGADRSFTTQGPPRITNEAPTGLEHNAAKLHAKVNPDELQTKYHFEYGTTTAYGTEVPLGGGSLGEGSAPVAVEASLTNLQIGTVYHYRVIAENSDQRTVGPDETFETIPPAPVDQSFATGVSTTEATLGAQINPLGNQTSYFFQYGTESCKADPSSCTDVPATPAPVGSGTGDVAESQRLSGLRAATTYFYRVIDQNVLGTTEGPEHSFTTQAGEAPFALADDRAWEMVSPPDKHGAPIEALTREGGVILASEDGDSITYVANGPITEEPQGNRNPEMQQVISTRTPEGWSSQDVATPNNSANGVSPGATPEYQYFSPDLSSALVEPWGKSPRSEPPLAPEATQKTIYIRDNSEGSYLPLVTGANVVPGTEFGDQLHFLDASPDLSHVVFESKETLTPAPSGPGLYEWAAGQLQFISLLPSGVPAHESELGFESHMFAHALSSDGTRVIWSVQDESVEGVHRGHLYMRDSALGKTIQLDAAQGAAEPTQGSAAFEGASADDSRVFFSDKQRLTPDSSAEPGQAEGKPDLYECEIIEEAGTLSCHLRDLTVDPTAGEHAAVPGFIFGVSEEGRSVYLLARGVLASNQNGVGERGEPGANNLYALHEEAGQWTTTFIAALSSEDSPEWEGSKLANAAYLTARVSPNGRYLAFMSAGHPTGYDNTDQVSGKHDEEVYLFDAGPAAGTPALTCISCNPSGARPTGVPDVEVSSEGLGLVVDRRKVWIGHTLAGNIPGWTAQSINTSIYQSRYLTDEGRLYFNSPDDLVLQATNHKNDVYQYEPSGLGSCQSQSGGCISLISGGASQRESAFLEATPDASNVFFLTEAQLLPQDTDTAFDVYDARVCSESSPCLTPPEKEAPGCGETAACRPASPAQPLAPAPQTTASGPGNPPPSAPKQENKGSKTITKAKPLTRAQKLAKALASCKKSFAHSKKRRKACEAHARKLYGPKHKKGKGKGKTKGKKSSEARKPRLSSSGAQGSDVHSSRRAGR